MVNITAPSYNLKIALEKAISILPARLELNKLLTTLSDEEFKQYQDILSEHEISKQIKEEQKLQFEDMVRKDREKVKEIFASNRFDAGGSYDPFIEIFSGGGYLNNEDGKQETHKLFKDALEEIYKDPEYKELNPYKDSEKTTKLIATKLFTKLAGNKELLSKVLDKAMNLDKKGKGFKDVYDLK